MIIRIIGVICFVAILVNLFTLLSHRRLREKYAVLWFGIGICIIALTVFPELLSWAAHLIGIAVPSNLLFAAMSALLVGVTLHLTWEQSRSEDRIRRLSEEIAILRADVRSLTIDRQLEQSDNAHSTAPAESEDNPTRSETEQ